MNNTTRSTGMRTYLPWIIAVVAVAALAANLLWDRQPVREGATVEELNQRLAALESADASANAGARLPASARAGGARARMGEGGLGAMEAPKSAEEVAAERERQLRQLEAQFASDAADPVGGPQTEDTLVDTISSEAMTGTGLKPDDVDIACKKNSCRIVGTFERMGDAQDWSLFYITAAGGNVLSQTKMVFVPTDDGRTEVRIYSSRAGG
jgi:hypothetical protein